MKLNPYLHFAGNCEEALNVYKSVLNGKVDIVTRYDNPAMNAPEDYKNKILHATLTFGDNTIMVSDTHPNYKITFGDNAALSLAPESEAEAKRIYDALSEGGQILMPLEKQFWGDYYGYFVDRFGVRWMVNASS